MGFFGLEIEKKAAIEGAFDTVIGGKAKFRGELVSSGAVRINGEFEGKLNAKEELIIAPGSKIVGDVYGGSVIVSGVVDGNITASHSLEITKTGRVHGDLAGGKIIIEEGSSYRGRVRVEGGASGEDESSFAPNEDGAVENEKTEQIESVETVVEVEPEQQTRMFQNV